jgi:hypothetical protein
MYTGLQQLAESSATIVKQSIDKKSKEIEEKNQTIKLFDNAADEVLLKSGALGQTLYDSTYDELVEAKKTYLQGIEEKDDKKRIEGLKYIQNHSAWVQEHKQFNLQLADDIKKGRLSDAHNNDEKGLDETHNMTQIMNGNYSRTSRNDQGDVVFHIKDRQGNEKKISSTEYKDMSIFKNFEVGTAYIKGRDALLNQEIFNGEALGQALLQAMPSDKKGFRAVIHDDILGRRGGKQNLRSMLETSTTLDEEIINALGQQGFIAIAGEDGKLDAAEKKAFIDAIVDVDNNNFDLDVSKRIMVEQLTNAAKNDHGDHWTEKNRKEQEKLEKYNQQQNPTGTNSTSYGWRNWGTMKNEYDFIGAGKEGDITTVKWNGNTISITRQKDGAWKYIGNDGQGNAKEYIWTRNQVKQMKELYHLNDYIESKPADNQKGSASNPYIMEDTATMEEGKFYKTRNSDKIYTVEEGVYVLVKTLPK